MPELFASFAPGPLPPQIGRGARKDVPRARRREVPCRVSPRPWRLDLPSDLRLGKTPQRRRRETEPEVAQRDVEVPTGEQELDDGSCEPRRHDVGADARSNRDQRAGERARPQRGPGISQKPPRQSDVQQSAALAQPLPTGRHAPGGGGVTLPPSVVGGGGGGSGASQLPFVQLEVQQSAPVLHAPALGTHVAVPQVFVAALQ